MAITITSGGTFVVVPGETYIIAPSVAHDVIFVPASGASTPVDFIVEVNHDNNSDFTVKMGGDDGDLSPEIDIADHVTAPAMNFDLKKTADAEMNAGDGVTVNHIYGSSNGVDEITFGDDAIICGVIDTKGGDDALTFGDNAQFFQDVFTGGGSDTVILGDDADFRGNNLDLSGSKPGGGGDDDDSGGGDDDDSGGGDDDDDGGDVDGDDTLVVGDGLHVENIIAGEGNDDLTIGEDAVFNTLTTDGGDDTVRLGDGAEFDALKMGEGDDIAFVGELVRGNDFKLDGGTDPSSGGGDDDDDDGGGAGDENDCLFFDQTWLTASERAQLEQLLIDNEYILNAGGDAWVADLDDIDNDNITSDQDFTLHLEGGGSIRFKNWEEIKLICFASGTLIATPRGEIAIEDLRIDDLVLTMDSGYQPIRWIGSSTVRAAGHLAPVRIKAGTFRNNRDIVVSPQHRILLKGNEIEMLLGQSEALVAAKHLVDGERVVVEAGDARIEYFHMLFDDHEIVFAEGMPSESFHPGAVGLGGMAHATRLEIIDLFPELEDDVAAYGQSCRPSLKAHEAKVAMRRVTAGEPASIN